MRKFSGIIILFYCVHFGYSQSCTQILNTAEDNYEAGRLLAITKDDLGFLECLGKKGPGSLSKEERIRAKKLLTKVYIFTDNEALAEIALIGLLKEEPEHLLDQTDPSELGYLMQQFRTAPIFRLGFRIGSTVCDPYIIGAYSVNNNNQFPKFYNGRTFEGETTFNDENGEAVSAQDSYSPGFMAEVVAERKLYKGLDATLGLQVRSTKYSVESHINSNIFTALTNNQTYIRVPLGLKYTLWNSDRSKKFLPYVFLGASADLLTKAYYESTRSGGSSFTISSPEDGDLIKAKMVNEFNYSYTVGVGAKLRVKTHFLTLDLRYDTSQKNYINSDNRLSGNKSFIFDSAYAEDDLSLNVWTVTGGFTYSVHKPRKLKEYR